MFGWPSQRSQGKRRHSRRGKERSQEERKKCTFTMKTHVGVLQSNDQLAAQLGFSSADDAAWTYSAAEGGYARRMSGSFGEEIEFPRRSVQNTVPVSDTPGRHQALRCLSVLQWQ